MSHFIASDPTLNNAVDPKSMHDRFLSIRTGKMSFIQYGFEHDPGEGPRGSFKSNQVILLVLNDHRNVHYQIEGSDGSVKNLLKQKKDHVCILWPKSKGKPPAALKPEVLFEHMEPGKRKQGRSVWPRESFHSVMGQGQWDAALVFLDPTGKYLYEYQAGPDKRADDYRFALGDQAIVPWLWEPGEQAPEPLLPDGQSVTRALEAESGGPQGEGGGALPYPPG